MKSMVYILFVNQFDTDFVNICKVKTKYKCDIVIKENT